MVKFLLEHALTLDEERDDFLHQGQESESPLTMEGAHLERSRITQSIIADIQNIDGCQ